jgi:cytochrome oxidase Cu insertion factor (SCO1/SenC/PrrC family)
MRGIQKGDKTMKTQNKLFMLLLILTFVISACGGTSTDTMEKSEDTMMEEKPAEESMAESHDDAMTEDTMEKPSDEAVAEDTMSDDAMMEAPTWYSASLTDVNTGESFAINDLKGKVILVETMAVWCSNCFKQQTQVKALHEALGEREDFVSLGIDIDPNEDADKLASFTSSNGFDWKYIVAPAEVAREISSLYGAQFLSPPSTPMLVIDRKGVAHPLPFGIKSADDLMQALQPFLDEGM